ncbi:MAG: D-alanine--D-alanine ligase [Treponema sp.]|jgi:D-alanine-D-alanine ligase|nr:D-alanine--D-alanine ligase [Treponema sp.]
MKIVVGILFGGKSAEHEISLLSAKNIYDAIDREKFTPVLIGIDKSGRWLLNNSEQYLLNADNPSLVSLNPNGNPVALQPEKRSLLSKDKQGSFSPVHLDVVFPILHGPFGEDGTIQGFLKLADIPFVGSGVLGSAVGMDKDVMKRLLRDAGVPIGKFIAVKSHEKFPSFEEAEAALGKPLFIKPANMGSSIGISKVNNEEEYAAAIKDAFLYDTKIIIEEFVPGREIECAVLGNEEPLASIPGEVIPSHEFYSYDAKYLDENGAALEIPAKLDEKTTKQIQQLAIKVFQTLCCEGLSRVDFFLKNNGDIIVNEINTMPGFTKISMYPKMWENSHASQDGQASQDLGISYTELITRLIELAISRFERDAKLNTTKQ